MTVRFVIAAACAAALCSAALPAAAACQLKANAIPVTMQGLRPIVAAKINGQEGHFLLDSGSVINSLNGKFAAALKLKRLGTSETGTHLTVDAQTDIRGVAGVDTINGLVKADRFDLQGMSFKDVGFMATDRIGGVDGLLGQAFLHRLDVEYDLGGGVVRLAKPEGCAGVNMAYWAKDGAAYSMIPMEWVDPNNPHTEAPIYINGVRMRAVFDTGAGSSFITENAAVRAGVRTSDAGVASIGEGQGVDAAFKAWVGTFASVKIGDEEIQNAPMVIGQSNSGFDVLLGGDFFLSHHIYVANSQEKIFFTYSGGPAFRVPRPKATTVAAIGPGQSPATKPGAAACAMQQVPIAPDALGGGTVKAVMTDVMIKTNIENAQALAHGLIDPAYADRSAVIVHLDSGQDQVGRLPPGLAVNIGDRVTMQGWYRNPALPCHYIPNRVIAALGLSAPRP